MCVCVNEHSDNLLLSSNQLSSSSVSVQMRRWPRLQAGVSEEREVRLVGEEGPEVSAKGGEATGKAAV